MAEEKIPGFAGLMQRLDEGAILAECSDELRRVTLELSELADATNSPRKGTLTLVLSITARPNATVDVHAEVKAKTPRAPRAGSTFWATAGGGLSAANPRQDRLPIRDVDAVKPAVVVPPADTPPARTV